MAIVSTILERGRAALGRTSDDEGLEVLVRSDAADAVAFLVTVGRAGRDLVVPLRGGRNLVGRGTGTVRPFGEWPRPAAVEQGQWLIDCDEPTADVRDAWSTNLSVLIPADVAAALPADTVAAPFARVGPIAGAILLPHANAPGGDRSRALDQGDLLRSYYAWFVFGWR